MQNHFLDHTFGEQHVTPDERRQRIRTLFDAIAGRYDLMNDLMSLGIHRWWKRRMVTHLPQTGVVVDLAGGTGDVARLLARVPTRQVVVCDPSGPMMQAGRARAASASLHWLGAEAEALPFADGSVALLTVAFGLRNVTHLQAALAEVARVLAPGGVFVCLEFSRPAWWLRPFYNAYSRVVIPRLGAWVARERSAYDYLIESIRRFPAQAEFAQAIAAAGLEAVSWRNLSFGIACLHRGVKPVPSTFQVDGVT